MIETESILGVTRGEIGDDLKNLERKEAVSHSGLQPRQISISRSLG